ncbi:MAG: V-type ATP synthase subunit I [Oscillospiraceae bacterium]|nr:V-type ATP synthase subunit I [Oscillospiraceae bacterium]
MAIVKMRKFRLLAFRDKKDELLRELMLLGCVEVGEPDDMIDDTSGALTGLVRRETSDAVSVRGDRMALESALEVLDKYAHVKTSLFAPRPTVNAEVFLDEGRLSDIMSVVKKINDTDEELRRLSSNENTMKNTVSSLLPWQSLDMDLGFTGTENYSVTLCIFPKSAKLNEANAALAQEVEEAELVPVNSDDSFQYASLVCHSSVQAQATECLRPFGFAAANVSGMKGTAVENIDSCREKLSQIQTQKDGLIARITELSSSRDDLKLGYDILGAKLDRALASERLLHTQDTVALVGWTTSPDEQALKNLLSKYECAWEFEDPVPEEYNKVPIKLKNNFLTRSLNMVTDMYSLPDYGNVDPNPLMAPFFILFYGIMMADMGYGILMMVISLIVCRKARPRGTMRNLFELMGWCGLATFVMGVLTGGFFGDLLDHIVPMLTGKEFVGFPSLFTPLNDTLMVLVGALVLGMIHIITGMIINFVHQTRTGHFWDALMDNGSWWLLFAGIALGALGKTWWVAIAGVVAIVATQGRTKPTIIGKIISGFAGLYDITSYFGDILSYSRLMALMLAGSVIAQVFNTLAAIPNKIYVFIPIFLIGHALNIGLNLLGCYVHDLRLQCLEYFGKFYVDGGRAFAPLSVKSKYADVKTNK